MQKKMMMMMTACISWSAKPREKWALRIPERRWHYYLLIPGSRVLLEKLTGSQLFK